MFFLAAEFQEHFFEVQGFGNKQGRTHEGSGIRKGGGLFQQRGQEILGVDDAENIVLVALIDGDTGVAMGLDQFADGRDAVVGLGADDVRPGYHDVSHLLFFQSQNIEQHGGIFLDQRPVLIGFQDEFLDGNTFLPEEFA